MLAALAIEKSYIPLPNLAAISIMRATNPGTSETIFKLIYPVLKNTPVLMKDLGVLSILTLTILLLIFSSVLGFTSTILLSDVVVQPILSRNIEAPVPVDFLWNGDVQEDGSDWPTPVSFGFHYIQPAYNYFMWSSSPPVTLPPFAEYASEPLAIAGLSDTGSSIRAFLPFTNPDYRSGLKSYTGKSLVWDARVICQKPRVTDFKTSKDPYSISGKVQSSVQVDIIREPKVPAMQFSCILPWATYTYGRPILCQLPNYNVSDIVASGLKSEFSLPDQAELLWSGNTYLVLNQTLAADVGDFLDNNSDWGRIGLIDDYFEGKETVVVGTLCRSPLDAVDRDVGFSSQRPQTEPGSFAYMALNASVYYETTLPYADLQYRGDSYDFSTILPRLVAGNSSDRLNMSPPASGWAGPVVNTTGSDGPWTLRDLSLKVYRQSFLVQSLDLAAGMSVFFWESAYAGDSDNYLAGRKWMGDLFIAVKDHPQGGTARALQAVLTMVANNAYYEYLQKFDRFSNATIVQFLNVSSPGGPYGTRRGTGGFANEQQGFLSVYVKGRFPVGYVIVVVLLVLHTILAFIILVRFLQETAITRIGDPWQTLAQVASNQFEIENMFELSRKTNVDRSAVEKELRAQEKHNLRVGIQSYKDTVRLAKAGSSDTV
ncbi:Mitochondrial outer membrane protein iml2 [Orbilia ellipsospora]|uniref:Mitochondrial outer membrane protein iml2 n=1 Tax=Orbilia ellipsospora TaxID=2528407 RepID=A0AAV9XFJ8_9PEZI